MEKGREVNRENNELASSSLRFLQIHPLAPSFMVRAKENIKGTIRLENEMLEKQWRNTELDSINTELDSSSTRFLLFLYLFLLLWLGITKTIRIAFDWETKGNIQRKNMDFASSSSRFLLILALSPTFMARAQISPNVIAMVKINKKVNLYLQTEM